MTRQDDRTTSTDVKTGRASFIDDPEVDELVARMYAAEPLARGTSPT